MTRRFLHLAAVLLPPSLHFPQPARRVLKIDEMHRFYDVRDAQISPDGKWVAYTRADCEAARLCGREEVPHAAAHLWRPQTAGTTKGDRLSYFCRKKLPTNIASMPEE